VDSTPAAITDRWYLLASRGVASPGNLLLLLATFVLFPIIGRVRMYGEQRLSPTPSVSQAARKHTDFFRSLTGRLTKIFWAMPSFGNSVHPYPQNLEREKGKSIRNMKFRCVTRRENTAPSLQGLEYTGCDY
jgi:hypothetical protein